MLELALTFWQTSGATTPTAEQINSGLFYVIAAYAVVFLMIFAYLVSIHRRQAQLKRDIELLREEERELGQRGVNSAPDRDSAIAAKPGSKQELG